MLLALTVTLLASGAMAVLLGRVRPLPLSSDVDHPDVAVVIPARNEADALPHLLADLSVQTLTPTEVVVVDDDSTDRTAELATAGGADVHAATGRPPGWNPKVWALTVGVGATTAPVLLFLDADVRLSPDAVARIATDLAAEGGLVSVAPFHTAEHPVESASALCNVLLAVGGGPGVATSARGAVGSCLAIARRDYDAIDGHRATPATIVDDLELARRAREAGLSTALRLGTETVRVRSYPGGIGDVWRGWTKNLAAGMRHTAIVPGATVGVWLMSTVLPLWFLLRGEVADAMVLWVAVAATSWWLTRRVGRFHPAVVTVGAPLLGAFVAAMTATSVARSLLGRPSTWKGRALDANGVERP